jgi:hypothetical protein
MAKITELGYPSGFLGLDDEQPTQSTKPNPNNLGNLRPVGSSKGFQQTESMEQGIKDIDNQLRIYGEKHGVKTLRQAISRWAPPSENDTEAYIKNVSQRTGINADEEIDFSNPAVRHIISGPIVLQEKGLSNIIGSKQSKQQQEPQAESDSPFALPKDTNEYKPFTGSTTKAQAQPKQSNMQGVGGKIQKFVNENAPTKEEFEQESMLAPLAKTYVGINRPLKTPEDNINLIQSAGADVAAKGERMVRGIGDVIMHPRETLQQIYENPGATLAGVAKGVLYNPTLNPLALKPKVAGVENLATKAAKLEAAKGFPEPKASPYQGATADLNAQFNAKKSTDQNIATTQTDKTNIPIIVENPPQRTSPISSSEQALREKEMKDIGITTIRKSALIDSPKEASSQFLTSQADQGPYGSKMTDLFNHEKNALDTHFKSLEEKLGGSVVEPGSLQQEEQRIAAGQNIKKGINSGFENWKKETDNLYNQAKESHGEKPVELNTFNEVFSKPENFTYGKENELKNSIKLVLERKKLLNEDGTVKPMTVQDSEEIRKLINKKYHYEVNVISSEMKNAIDNDVFSQVGGEVYQKARSHFGQGKDIYENPKAMNDLLGDKGVNEKWTDEQVIAKVNALPQKQFDHLFNTLVRDGQTDSINQIKTSLINQIRQAGKSAENMPFNSVATSNQAAKLGSKLKTVFSDDPTTMEEILKGLRVAKYTHVPSKYQGAGVQTHLLKNKLLESGIQKAGAGAGAAAGAVLTGGPIGAGLGAAVGESGGVKLSSLLKSNRQNKQFKKEVKD